jgi:hypothetical protein
VQKPVPAPVTVPGPIKVPTPKPVPGREQLPAWDLCMLRCGNYEVNIVTGTRRPLHKDTSDKLFNYFLKILKVNIELYMESNVFIKPKEFTSKSIVGVVAQSQRIWLERSNPGFRTGPSPSYGKLIQFPGGLPHLERHSRVQ